MKKPSFGVTAFAIVTLSFIGVLRAVYEPSLPSSTTEYIVSVPPTESLPAPIVEINWKRSVEEGIKEAKKRRLGILFFFIEPSSITAKKLEIKVLRDPEMARFVNRNFVPVKVNLDLYPEWSQIILPIQRLGRYYDPAAELVVSTQDGVLVDHFSVTDPFQYFGPEALLPFLIQCKSLISQGDAVLDSNEGLKMQQSADLKSLIMTGAEPLPYFSEFKANLQREISLSELGKLKGGSTIVSPMGLRVLAKLGEPDEAISILERLAMTPIYDVVDGGFFHEARVDPNSITVDTSKSAANNALSAVVAAQLGCVAKNPIITNLGIDIGNGVVREFLSGNQISTSRLNDQNVDLTSRRSSLSRRRLNEIFTQKEKRALLTWISTSQSQDQALGSLLNLSALNDPDFLQVRQKLREKIKYTPGLSESDHISVDGYIAARLFDLYRYTNDSRFLVKAREIAEQVYSALSKDSVSRVFGDADLGAGWLGSYLAVADCGLSHFAATGEIYPLRSGEVALNLSIKKFRDPITGLLDNTAHDPGQKFLFNSAIPDLADRGRESLNSQAIRLAFNYSVTSERDLNRSEFLDFAQSVMLKLNAVMRRANTGGAGFYDAVVDLVSNRAVLVAGPNRVEIANRLVKQYPFSLIYPMSEGDLPAEDFFYVRRGNALEGPYSADEIQKKLAVAARSYPQ